MQLTRNRLRQIIQEEVRRATKQGVLKENISGEKAAAVLALYAAIDLGMKGSARDSAGMAQAMRDRNYSFVVSYLNENYTAPDSDDLQHYGWFLVSDSLGDKGIMAPLPNTVVNQFRKESADSSARAMSRLLSNQMPEVQRALDGYGFSVGGGGVDFRVSGRDVIEACVAEAREHGRTQSWGGGSFLADMF